MDGNLSFNTNSLQTYTPATGTGIITNSINHASIPDKVAAMYQLANANSSAIPFIDYPSKAITIAGVIKGTGQADLDDRIDNFKGIFNGKNKDLDIAYSSTTRRYIATVNTLNISERNGALDFVNFTVEFICTQPFGTDTTATEMFNVSAHTSAMYTTEPTIAGNAPTQLPIFTITINALTGDGDYMQISNDSNGQELLLYGYDFEAGDVVIINCAERTVTLNGTLIDYAGVFIELEPGAQPITYSDGFTTRSVDLQAEYNKLWL